ncbi:type I-B CRISPR-associated endonuclease Cas1 [Vallitalea pronyensis]|uniref:CRISPR-associated endonuclease Cas1 n=1 Tax=Vallitalea pronyensis TaxID=1348613 RepID=A0A8J8MM31_9FIRM|nr:type I-B CRISPR-associated endonuclease Cas1b [Vallitalea pronyensis]QUI23974.1 type I-B CRISPR-associated endonuclease Cas1 [Vallitalea pronyensis]
MKKDIFIFKDGELKRKDNTILFLGEEQQKYLPIEQVDAIWVFGEVTLNKRFLEIISTKEICIHFFNHYGYYLGTYYPREHLNSGLVILKQVNLYSQDSMRMPVAKEIIKTAVKNILIVLKYYRSRSKLVSSGIETIESMATQIEKCQDINELMAYEGNIRGVYYQNFNDIIDNDNFQFIKRSKRPPLDGINALISFGNSLMYTSVLSEIYKTHLDPRIGILHATNGRKFSLNLDIAEVFKPIVVDRIIFNLINRKVITEKDFKKQTHGTMLTEKGKKKFLKEYTDKMMSTIKHPRLNQYVTYKRLIRLELYKIQRHIVEGDNYKGFVARW